MRITDAFIRSDDPPESIYYGRADRLGYRRRELVATHGYWCRACGTGTTALHNNHEARDAMRDHLWAEHRSAHFLAVFYDPALDQIPSTSDLGKPAMKATITNRFPNRAGADVTVNGFGGGVRSYEVTHPGWTCLGCGSDGGGPLDPINAAQAMSGAKEHAAICATAA